MNPDPRTTIPGSADDCPPSAPVIFGIKEMSWPKGDGYLFLRLSDSRERPLFFLDLYTTTDTEFELLLKQVLPTILLELPTDDYLTENLSNTAERIFDQIAVGFGLKRPITST